MSAKTGRIVVKYFLKKFCKKQWPISSLLNNDQVEFCPEMTIGMPQPGNRVKIITPEYVGTDVHHSLYLPIDWQPNKKYPVMVEYTGNYDPFSGSTGKVQDAHLGYGLCGLKGWIWVILPFIEKDHKQNAVKWWGAKEATIEYCKVNVPRICEDFNGDIKNVFICGFSRGAIAVNYIGLADDEISALWRGFIAHDHYDGVKEDWPYPGADRSSALKRLKRLQGRSQLICANKNSFARQTRKYLTHYQHLGKFSFIDIPISKLFKIPNDYFISPHTDLWMCKDSKYRKLIRQWLALSCNKAVGR